MYAQRCQRHHNDVVNNFMTTQIIGLRNYKCTEIVQHTKVGESNYLGRSDSLNHVISVTSLSGLYLTVVTFLQSF
jgi:hypothetical protein